MATSNSVDYVAPATTIVNEALRVLGVLEEGITATQIQLDDAKNTFNLMIKGLMAHGLNLWTIRTATITLVAGQAVYTFAPAGAVTEKAMKITDAVIRDPQGNDTTMIPLTRQEYWLLSDKNQTGFPVQYYYDPQRVSGNFTIWPTAGTAFTTHTLQITYQRQLEDIDSLTTLVSDDIDFPPEWHEAIKYQLAVRLAPMYGLEVNARQILKQEADSILKLALDFDTEQESIYLRPDRDQMRSW